jgi:hypothetical protein
VTVARLNPKLSVGVCQGRYHDSRVRGFWIGFDSEDKNELRRLPREMLFKQESVTQPGKFIASPDLDHPVIEYRDGEGWVSAFGIYFGPGVELDMCRAIRFVCEVLVAVPGFENSVKLDDAGLDIAALESDASLGETERKQLIDARIGQGAYRQGLEKLWDNKCAVLGITNRQVLCASHIKP